MARPPSRRMRQRQTFLRALASGASAAQACAHSRLASSTLYLWRRQDAQFRVAWDEAAQAGAEFMGMRRDDEMTRRALEPVVRPIVHRGEVVGMRQRYSDAALMFAVRDLRLRQELRQPQPAVREVMDTPRMRVIIAPVDDVSETADADRLRIRTY